MGAFFVLESLSAIHNSQEDSQDYLAVLVVQNMKENNTMEENRETIRVVYLEPGRLARTIELGTELTALQRAVGGLIEACYPFDEPVCIVCNDEGKINGMRPCRAVYGEDGRVSDIIFGPFLFAIAAPKTSPVCRRNS